jgi:pimeloyl-ACP methyl ester carboxylesterase
MLNVVYFASAALVAYYFLLWFAQRWVMFPGAPFPFLPQSPESSETLRVAHTGPQRQWEVWHLLPPAGARAPTIVFAHGNAELIDLWVEPFEELRRLGFGVVLVEYPGYGRSAGMPSKPSVEKAMLAAYDYAVSQPEVDPDRMIGYGRSLGGAVVCAASTQRRFAALVVQSSFSSVQNLVARYGLWGPLIRDPFDSVAALRRFDGPVLILHGERDRIIGPQHSDLLARAAPRAELQLMQCGHNDCPHPWKRVVGFLRQHTLTPSEVP